MFRFLLSTTVIVVIQLVIFYFLSPMFNLAFYDAVFMFGALTCAIVFFFSSKGDVYEKKTNHSAFITLGRTLGYDNMKTENYSIELNPLLLGSVVVTLGGAAVSLVIFLVR
ncbi:hypothetical protein IM538_14105 [Cytobacillus suaedae]|nr:hypothetical protein IM538_14105 [Cytobacillus suaedae]